MALNLYSDVAQFQRRFANNMALDASDLAEIERAMEAVSRRCDEFCRRTFYAAYMTRTFHGNGQGLIRIPDLISATSVMLDEDTDNVYEVTLVPTDYWLEREGYFNLDALPHTVIKLNPFRGARAFFVPLPRVLQIAGLWGFTAATEREPVTATLADAATTAMATSGPGALAQGQTLTIAGEQMYVTGGAGNAWTVTRGVNGTTPAAHGAGSAIDRYVYVPQVREAVLIMAGRLWKRRDTAYSNVIANPVVGQFEVFKNMDPDVAELLQPLRQIEAR